MAALWGNVSSIFGVGIGKILFTIVTDGEKTQIIFPFREENEEEVPQDIIDAVYKRISLVDSGKLEDILEYSSSSMMASVSYGEEQETYDEAINSALEFLVNYGDGWINEISKTDLKIYTIKPPMRQSEE